MATREENLQKINEDLEQLDDEQLEQIAGGWRMRPYINDSYQKEKERLKKIKKDAQAMLERLNDRFEDKLRK